MESASPGLPRWALLTPAVAGLVLLGLALGLAVGMPTLRQRRLLQEAEAICRERSRLAEERLARSGAVGAALAEEEAAASGRRPLMLRPDEELPLARSLESTMREAAVEPVDVRFGTPRRGEVLAAVAASMRGRGAREDLPPLLDRFYAQQRVVRLLSLVLSVPPGDEDVELELRWEYAVPLDRPPTPRDLLAEFAVPRVAFEGSLLAVDAANREEWRALERASAELLALEPRLRALAEAEARLDRLEREGRALDRWQEASRSEAKAVQRRLPGLFRALDVSALGRVRLRPGPGGALVIDEGR